MAANDKAKYEVQVDIDVSTGKINADKLLNDVSKQVTKKLSNVKKQKIETPITFDTKKVVKDVQTVTEALDKQLRDRIAQVKALKKLNRLSGKQASEAINSLEKKRTAAAVAARKVSAQVATAVKSSVSLQVGELKRLGAQVTRTAGVMKDASNVSKTFAASFGGSARARAASSDFSILKKEIDARIQLLRLRKDERLITDKGVTGRSGFSRFAAIQKEIEAGNRLKGNLGQVDALRKKNQKTVDSSVGSVNKMAAAMSAAGKQQNAMSLGLAKISEGLKKQKQDAEKLAKAQKSLKDSTSSFAKAQKELAAANERVNIVNKAGLSASSRVSALKSQQAVIERNIIELGRLRNATLKAGQSTLVYDRKLKSLRKSLRETERALRGPTKSALEFANSLKTFVRFAVAFKVLGGISNAIGFLTGNVISLEDALKSIQAVSNSTAEEMVVVENAIKNVATTTQFTTTEIAESAQTLAQAGIGPDKIADTLSAVANFAAATNASLTVSADLISTMKNVFKELDPVQIADELTNAINISKLTAGDLQTILSRLAQTAQSFNITSRQMLSAVTVLKNAGIKASTVSTGLRQGLLELLSPDAKTLKVLEKRYAAIGENLSQAAISNIFSNFARDDNPILRVLNELEKLGIEGSGAKDFQRVFDVRAENVIKALIANKEQFVLNTEAIGRTGAAAKGAKTQLTSLTKSASNLAAVVSVLASDVAPPFINFLKGIVEQATKATSSLRELVNEQKELTGSSGIGASLQVGASVGAAVAVKGGGAVKAALSGAVATVIAGAVNTQAGKAQPITEGVTNAISAVASIVAGIGLFKSFFPGKDVSALSSKAEFMKKKVLGVKGFVGATTKLIGRLNVFLLTLTSVAGILDLFVDESTQEALDRVAAQRASLGQRIEGTKKEIADLENALANRLSEDTKAGDTSRQISLLESTVEGVTGSISNNAVDFLTEAAKGVKDAGSSVFKENLDKFNSILKEGGRGGVSASEFVGLLQELSNITDKAEGERVLFMQELKAAYSSAEQPESQKFIQTFEAMSSEQQAFFTNNIDDAEQAKAFFASQRTARVSGTSILEIEEELALKREELQEQQVVDFEKQLEAVKSAQAGGGRSVTSIARDRLLRGFSSISGFTELFFNSELDSVEALRVQLRGIQEQSKAVAKSQADKVRGTLAELVEAGAENTVNEFISLLEDDTILNKDQQKQAVDVARENARSGKRQVVQDKLNALALKGQEQNEETKTIDQVFQQTSEATVTFENQAFIDSENKAQLLREQVTINQQLRDNYLEQKKALDATILDRWAILALSDEERELLEVQKDVEAKLLKARTDTLEPAQKIAELERGFVLDEVKIAEIDRQIAAAKKAQLQDTEKTAELAKERFKIEEQNLLLLEKALEAEIKKALGNNIDTGSLGLSGILDKFSGEAGRDFLRALPTEEAKTLSGLFKKAGEVTADLASAEDRLAQELDNTLRKPLDAKLKKAESALAKQHSQTSKLESQLSRATDKLTKAREDLAKEYDKQAADELFFQQVDREFAGEAATQKGDAKALLRRSAGAGTNEEAIGLAKEAISTARTLVEQGDLSAAGGSRIKDKAKSAIKEARDQEIRLKQQEVDRRAMELQEVAVQHAASLSSEKALQTSVDTLKEAINTLPDKIKQAVAALRGDIRGEDPLVKAAKKTGEASKSLTKSAKDSGTELSSASESLKEASEALKDSAAALRVGNTNIGTGGTAGSVGDGKDDAASFGENDVGVSFVKDLGKNTAQVAADDTTRFKNLTNANLDDSPSSQALRKRILQNLNPSVIQQGFSVGGLITGPGNGQDDKAGNFALSNNEFVHPAAATEKYGREFMEQVRSLRFPVSAVRSTPSSSASGAEANSTTGAEAVASAVGGNIAQESLRPVTLNVGGSVFETKATDDSLSSFRKSLAMQALKTGKKGS